MEKWQKRAELNRLITEYGYSFAKKVIAVRDGNISEESAQTKSMDEYRAEIVQIALEEVE